MTSSPPQEPRLELQLGNSRITLLGTAHVSPASAAEVRRLIAESDYDAVAVELCPSRYDALLDPDRISRMDLFQVLREGKATMVMATLALGAFQQRLAEQFGIEPGAAQREAIHLAHESGRPVLLIDREIGVTLRRIAHNVPWWQRLGLFAGLLSSVMSREEVSEEEIERLKEGDVLESTFARFAREQRALYAPLIEERDRYMAARLRQEVKAGGHGNILAVVGAGHLRGIARFLGEETEEPAQVVRALDQAPPRSRWPRVLGWTVVALVLSGFVLGFLRNPGLGWSMIGDWVLINGSLSALGALMAAAHPATVVTAFVAAPLTSLNPTIGAGMVAAAAEIFLRRPSVGDFHRLRGDTVRLRGWWGNRVSRVLLVFLFSTLGSAVGTYLAGFRILGRLAA